MNILVRAPNWIGDQIIAYPFFYYLRQKYPQARIVVACTEWVKDIQFLNQVDEVFVLPRVVGSGLKAKWRALQESIRLMKEKEVQWDLGFALPHSFSSAWFLKQLGVKERFGYEGDLRSWLLTRALPWNPDPLRHRGQAYVDLLELSEETFPGSHSVRVFWGRPSVSEGDFDEPGVLPKFDPEKEWPGVTPIEPPSGEYWVMAPGATAVSRRWFENRFIQFARKVTHETTWSGVIVGGPKEAPIADRICEDRALRLKDFTGKGSVAALWKLFSNARFTITNESGLAHMASLCGSAVQIVCGAADPRRTTPLGPGRVQVQTHPVECWPCERNFCRQPEEQYLQCLKGIEVDSVWESVQSGFRI